MISTNDTQDLSLSSPSYATGFLALIGWNTCIPLGVAQVLDGERLPTLDQLRHLYGLQRKILGSMLTYSFQRLQKEAPFIMPIYTLA